MVIKCNTGYLNSFIGEHEWEAMKPQVKLAHEMLHGKTGLGNDFLLVSGPVPENAAHLLPRRSIPSLFATAKC